MKELNLRCLRSLVYCCKECADFDEPEKGIQGPRFERFFSPSRVKPFAGFSEFVTENEDAYWRLVADRFGVQELEKTRNLAGVVELPKLMPPCAMQVRFKAIEKSWDSPFHGGRFGLLGKVDCRPPRADLGKIAFKGNK